MPHNIITQIYNNHAENNFICSFNDFMIIRHCLTMRPRMVMIIFIWCNWLSIIIIRIFYSAEDGSTDDHPLAFDSIKHDFREVRSLGRGGGACGHFCSRCRGRGRICSYAPTVQTDEKKRIDRRHVFSISATHYGTVTALWTSSWCPPSEWGLKLGPRCSGSSPLTHYSSMLR